MNNRLTELQEKEQAALSQIQKLKAAKDQAEAAVYENPSSNEAAMRAVALEMQIKAAQKAADKAAEAIEAELERLESKEYKAAVKQVNELEKQANEIQAEGIALIRSFYDKYHKFVEVTTEHADLANKHDIEHKPLLMRDRAEAGLDEIHRALIPWYSRREHIEYRKQHPIGG